jgi:putative PIN family toxin of toxin-antitoxin system
MLRIVIDTNVFVSAIILPQSAPAQILRSWKSGAFGLINCQKAVDELDEVLQRSHIAEKYSIDRRKRESFIDLILENSILVAGDTLVDVVQTDPKDDMFVSCAVEGQAKYIVSGDKHLKNLKRYEKIRIIEPIYFLRILQCCNRIYS